MRIRLEALKREQERYLVEMERAIAKHEDIAIRNKQQQQGAGGNNNNNKKKPQAAATLMVGREASLSACIQPASQRDPYADCLPACLSV